MWSSGFEPESEALRHQPLKLADSTKLSHDHEFYPFPGKDVPRIELGSSDLQSDA